MKALLFIIFLIPNFVLSQTITFNQALNSNLISNLGLSVGMASNTVTVSLKTKALSDASSTDKVKIGFNAPIIDWFRDELKDWMLDIMDSKSFLESSFFDGRQLQDNFHKFLNNENVGWEEAWQFWGAVHITKWQDHGREK